MTKEYTTIEEILDKAKERHPKWTAEDFMKLFNEAAKEAENKIDLNELN